MKNGKARGLSGVVTEIVKPAAKGGVDLITNLINHIAIGVIPPEWELSTIVNCHKGKRDSL